MRKTILFLVLWFSVSNVFAQQAEQNTGEPLSKRGRPILPGTGNYGLGFDAVPFLEYLGNIFNGTTNNTIGADFVGNSQQVFGKYFLSDDLVIRGRVRVDQDMDTERNRVILDNQPIPDADVEVTDEWIIKSTFVRVGGGMEFRKGIGRVVGVFGGEVSALYGSGSTEYDYGNPITEENQAPSSTFGFVNGSRFERIVEEKESKQLGLGVNGFVGVEYFVAPKIAVGAEFTLGFDFVKDFREQDRFEFWDVTSGSIKTRSSVSEGGNSLSIATGNSGGSINLMFYF